MQTETCALPLTLHAYSGKENGLMVIGTPESLAAVGQQLLAPSLAGEGSSSPRLIAEYRVRGPYHDIPDFRLSFHLQDNGSQQKAVPLSRRHLPPLVWIVIATCTLVGAVTIVQMAARYAATFGFMN